MVFSSFFSLLPCLFNFFCLCHLLNSSNNTEKLFATSIIPCTLKIIQEKKNDCHSSQSPERGCAFWLIFCKVPKKVHKIKKDCRTFLTVLPSNLILFLNITIFFFLEPSYSHNFVSFLVLLEFFTQRSNYHKSAPKFI